MPPQIPAHPHTHSHTIMSNTSMPKHRPSLVYHVTVIFLLGPGFAFHHPFNASWCSSGLTRSYGGTTTVLQTPRSVVRPATHTTRQSSAAVLHRAGTHPAATRGPSVPTRRSARAAGASAGEYMTVQVERTRSQTLHLPAGQGLMSVPTEGPLLDVPQSLRSGVRVLDITATAAVSRLGVCCHMTSSSSTTQTAAMFQSPMPLDINDIFLGGYVTWTLLPNNNGIAHQGRAR